MSHPGPRPRWTPLDIAEGNMVIGNYRLLRYDGYERKTPKHAYHWYVAECTACKRVLRRAQASISRAADSGTTHCQLCKHEGKDKKTHHDREVEKDRIQRIENQELLKLNRLWPIASKQERIDHV